MNPELEPQPEENDRDHIDKNFEKEKMLVVVNIDPGSTLNELMTFLAERHVTFSFTDQLWKLCDKTVTGEKKEISTQTDTDAVAEPPMSKKSRQSEECASPCSSATPSEPTTNGIDIVNISKNSTWDQMVRNNMSLKREKEDETLEIEDEEDAQNDFMHSEILQLMLSKIKTESESGGASGDMDEDSMNSLGDMSTAYGTSPSAAAIRFKPTYASTKRGVCQVCNREVSLITTHRKRHAITHLGFKTLKCAVCHKYFSRQDLASGHFKKDHPDAEYTPFLDTMSSDDEKQLSIMMTLCFPDELTKKGARSKEGTPGSKRTRI